MTLPLCASLLILATTPSAPPAPEEFTACARISEVVSASEVRINRGQAHGLTADMTELTIKPMRSPAEGKAREVEPTVISAYGAVTALEAHSATLTLTSVLGEVTVGDVLLYNLIVPEGWRGDPLFYAAANDTQLTAGQGGEPLWDFAAIMADPTAATREAILDRIVAEVRRHADEYGAYQIEGGAYHGRKLVELVRLFDRAQLERLLVYLNEYQGSYLAIDFEADVLVANWLVAGAPEGTDQRLKAKAQPLLERGDTALGDGDLAAAEEAYREALKLVPADQEARAKLDRAISIRTWSEQLARDPDDTLIRWQRMEAWMQISATKQASRDLDLLEAAGYNPDGCARQRGFIAVKEGRYLEGVQILEPLAEKLGDEGLVGWVRYARALAKQEADPQSFSAQIEIARVHEADKTWDSAAQAYRAAVVLATTDEERQEAGTGQERIAALKEANRQIEIAISKIESHQAAAVLAAADQAIARCKAASSIECLIEVLKRLASSAYENYEVEMSIELRRGRAVEIDPENSEAWIDYSDALYGAARYQEAREAADRALALKPGDPEGLQRRALALLELGEFDAASVEIEAGAKRDPTAAWPHRLKARVLAARGEWDGAFESISAALQRDPGSSHTQERYAAVVIGREATQQIAGNQETARNQLRLVRALLPLRQYRQAEAIAAKITDPGIAGEAYWEICSTDVDDRPLAELIAAAERATISTPRRKARLEVLRALEAAAKPDAPPAARVRVAKAWNSLGQMHRALAALGDLAHGSDDEDARAEADRSRRIIEGYRKAMTAAVALTREDFASAASLYREALAIYDAVGSTSDVLSISKLLGVALRNLGQFREAAEVARVALARANEYGDPLSAAALENELAIALSDSGTLDAFERAIDSWERVGRDLDLAWVLFQANHDRSALAGELGQSGKALEWANAAEREAQRSGSDVAKRASLGRRIDALIDVGRQTEAQPLAEQLLKSAREARSLGDERMALVFLGLMAMRRGDAAGAMASFESVYELGRRSGVSSHRALARRMQGQVQLFVAHQPVDAIKLLVQARELAQLANDHWEYSRTGLMLGQAQIEAGQIAEGRKTLREVRDGFRAQKRGASEAAAEVELAHGALAAGELEPALASAQTALAIARKLDSPQLLWEAWYAAARAYEKSNRLDEAMNAYQQAVEALVGPQTAPASDEEQSQKLEFGRTRRVFSDAVDLAIRLGRIDLAMEIAQRSRDASLRKKLDAGEVKAADPKLQSTLDDVSDAEARSKAAKDRLSEELAKPTEEQSQEKIATLSEIAAKSEGELRQLLLQLKRDHRQLYAMLAFSPESISRLRQQLPEDVLVVQYFITESAGYIFTLRRDASLTRAHKIPVGGIELRDTVYEFVQQVRMELPRAPQLGAKLFDWLLAPIEADLKAARTTLLVPFGCLHYLPFQALAPLAAEGSAPHYAIERYRLGYLSSTTLYELTAPREPHPATLLAFANPDGTLSGARKEVESVVKNGFFQAKVLYEQEAIEPKFYELASGFRILHFATHGIITPDPASSHLKLAGSELTVNEIMGFEGLQGKTDLVVLSACQTALEKGQATEDEPISIASAFATAGAPALIASLWSVSDEATFELVTRLYAGLQQRKGTFDTLEALRQAQLAVMKLEINGGRPFEAPRYWAAFGLIGDYR
jgi:CHAT domain-containing protein